MKTERTRCGSRGERKPSFGLLFKLHKMKKTANSNTANISENTSTELLKALALKQFNSEDFFLSEDGSKAYEGVETDIHSDWIETTENLPNAQTWDEFCEAECVEIEPLEDDEERDGYIVLTDEEADERAKASILDSVWAFNASFLSDFTGFDIEVFEAIQNNQRCESNNDALLSMIDDKDDFVEQAISADGRGHFMSSYDGNENEETINGETFYIYRMN